MWLKFINCCHLSTLVILNLVRGCIKYTPRGRSLKNGWGYSNKGPTIRKVMGMRGRGEDFQLAGIFFLGPLLV